MAKRKTWTVEMQFAGTDTQRVKTRSLGEIPVIPPSEMEDTEYTVVGILSTARKKFTGDKAAVLEWTDGRKADLLSRLSFSKLLGCLPTSEEGMYIAVRKPRISLLWLLPLLLAALLIAGMLFLPSPTDPPEEEPVPEIETNISDAPKTAEEIKEEKPSVTLPGWGSICIAADTTDVTVNFANPEKNAGCYYLTFELLLKNGEETESLYQSGLVEPGKYVTDITLSRPLSAGEYDAVVHMQPYTMSDPPTATNSGDVGIKLIVQ